MASGVDQRRAEFKRYKEDVQSRGKPFHPFAMWHDTVMSLVVVLVIIGLACLWYFDSGEDPEDVGVLGPRYTGEADPGTTSFIPRPDWFFFFLFYLLRIFKWPETVVLGTVGIPTICLILLLALPFLDVRRERRIIRRPVALVAGILVIISMGVLTYKGATAEEGGEVGAELVTQWIEEGGLEENLAEGATIEQAQLGGRARGRVGLPQLPHLPRRRLAEPRRARPDPDRGREPRRRLLPPLRREPEPSSATR